jgi:hypothetical protein
MTLGFGLYGLGSAVTDPGAEQFAARVRDELNVDIVGSPYRYWQVDEIVGRINCAPSDAKILLWGSSLGANNSPVIASQTSRSVAGMWGFQASQWGAKVGVTANVAFAHFVFNPFVTLGSYKPQLAEGNGTTDIYWTESWDDHPGDQVVAVQDMFLADMNRRISGTPLK